MKAMETILLADLRQLISELGADGGLTSPAIYDTSRVLCLAPPPEGVWPALGWLLEQQHDDGGWGDPALPRARDLPTLAAVLALHTYGSRREARKARDRGLAMLRRQAIHWHGPLPTDLTAGVELLLPALLRAAADRGLAVDPAPYNELAALGARRRRAIAELRPGVGTTPLHSWEAWGTAPDPSLIDENGSIGHSPTATASWLHLAEAQPGLATAKAAARDYLARAARATEVGLPGVVPTCWPTPRFEQVFALQALYLGGALSHPALADIVAAQLDAIAGAFRRDGIGFSDCFAPDGDDTAAAIALLHTTGRPIAARALTRFADDDHFCAWHRELQPSLSVTAHATHTLHMLGEDTTPYEGFLVRQQLPDGRWPGDKWNRSWLYTTWRVLVALGPTAHTQALQRAIGALLAYQQGDGGWGTARANPEETAYAVLALRSLSGNGGLYDECQMALYRGDRWLRQHYSPFAANPVACWLAKESYRPHRIARAIELTALLSGL